MRALLLCGGFATRLEPITYFIPKPLLPIGVGGKPIIEYILDDLVSSGVTDIVLSTNSKFSNAFEYWVRHQSDGVKANVSMVVEHTAHNKEKFGAIKGIEYAIEQGKIDEDLIIIAGDNLYDFSVSEIIQHFNKDRKPTIGLYDTKDLEGAKRFGNV
ncbi:MAG: NTP transferase domain-containing protein, partial [Candidatus Micrarchaeota archaeon]|nr:NTP transferase domain-containing protein [Candidatus Micrarchaeota archaeon]